MYKLNGETYSSLQDYLHAREFGQCKKLEDTKSMNKRHSKKNKKRKSRRKQGMRD